MLRKWPLLLGLLLGVAALFVGLHFGESPDQKWQLAARYTARTGFLLLMITFTASPLARLWPSDWSRALLRDRRWWGLGFAACHTIHLAALIERSRLAGEPISPAGLIGGGAAYALLYAMVFTSNNVAQRTLGPYWRRLHKVGIYYLWLIFSLTYLGAAFRPESRMFGMIFAGIAFGGLVLRIVAWWSVRAKRARPI